MGVPWNYVSDKTHQECDECDRLEEEAFETAKRANTSTWTSDDGQHRATVTKY